MQEQVGLNSTIPVEMKLFNKIRQVGIFIVFEIEFFYFVSPKSSLFSKQPFAVPTVRRTFFWVEQIRNNGSSGIKKNERKAFEPNGFAKKIAEHR